MGNSSMVDFQVVWLIAGKIRDAALIHVHEDYWIMQSYFFFYTWKIKKQKDKEERRPSFGDATIYPDLMHQPNWWDQQQPACIQFKYQGVKLHDIPIKVHKPKITQIEYMQH